MNNDELKHYGVVGMKWGVRRGSIDRVNTKAAKQLAKYDKKIEKQGRKITKASQKYNKYKNSFLFRKGPLEDKWERKLNKAVYKQEKTAIKGQKFVNEMSKSMSEAGYKPKKEHIDAGKRYAEMAKKFEQKRIDSVYYR